MTRLSRVICWTLLAICCGCGSQSTPSPESDSNTSEASAEVAVLQDGEQPLSRLAGGVTHIRPDLYATILSDVVQRSRVIVPQVPADQDVTASRDANPGYVGPDACAECHSSYYKSCLETAHFRTASFGVADSPLGGDVPPQIESGDPSLWYRIDRREEQLLQSVVVEEDGQRFVRSFPVSIVTGSGRHGQTYLSWHEDSLFQLPVSYIGPGESFMHSPGFKPGVANFARPVSARCLECHATWFAQISGTINRFSAGDAIAGVTCEVCHGPGKEHVTFHRAQPDETEARHIVNPHTLSRERLIDLCSLCHGGAGDRLRSPFSFRPGDRLAEHLKLADDAGEHSPMGVHAANQSARLARSKCFQMTQMSCTDCHDVHSPGGTPASFARNCLSCHKSEQCSEVAKQGEAFAERCVDCHMPLRGDNEIRFHTETGDFVPAVRDHFISIWPDVVRDVAGENQRQ